MLKFIHLNWIQFNSKKFKYSGWIKTVECVLNTQLKLYSNEYILMDFNEPKTLSFKIQILAELGRETSDSKIKL